MIIVYVWPGAVRRAVRAVGPVAVAKAEEVMVNADEQRRPPGPALVTGATGMLGGRIVQLLVADGREVRALARPGAETSALSAAGAEVFRGDVTDPGAVQRAVDGCGAVFHTAGLVPASGAPAEEFHRVNAGGTRNVLRAALEAGVKRALHVSTINTLDGRPGEKVDEAAPPPEAPHRGYDASKVAAEDEARACAGAGLDLVIVNPAVIFGPRSRYSGKLIELFLRGRLPVIPTPGRRMSFVFVDDAARGCLLALERGRCGERYILAREPVTIREFIGTLAEVSGRRRPCISLPTWPVALAVGALSLAAPVTRWRPPVTVTGVLRGGVTYDGTKAGRELGLEHTPLNEALGATVAWLRRGDDR